jgi:tagatose 1,6-diphosphate aldolase GatY/KbaY
VNHFSPLRSSLELLQAAARERRAVAALNFYNAETLRAHVEAARAEGAPLILQTTESTIRYLGLAMIVAMARAAALELATPVALHLDHGSSLALAYGAILAGYSSVMIDGSALSFDENCELTRKVVELAHPAGVSVEAELGHVGQATRDDAAACYTQPDAAARFVERTRVDALAVAIGTAHGFYRGEVRLDFERLDAIRAAVPQTPLVLHGGSGVPAELVDRAIAGGIAKLNIGTEIKDTFTEHVRDALSGSDDIDLRRTFSPAIGAVRDLSRRKMRLCARLAS